MTDEIIIRLLKWLKWLGGTAIATLVLVFSRFFVYKSGVPPHQWPIFIAPIVSTFVSALTFFDYIIDRDAKEGLNQMRVAFVAAISFLGIALSLTICVFLTALHEWLPHLALLLALFIVFVSWDLLMLAVVDNAKCRGQIEAGHFFLNRPSIVAILLCMVFLWLISDPPLLQTAAEARVAAAHHAASRVFDKDSFASGLISFHLIVSAFVYVSTTLGTIAAPNRGLARTAYLLFRWVPSAVSKKSDAVTPAVNV